MMRWNEKEKLFSRKTMLGYIITDCSWPPFQTIFKPYLFLVLNFLVLLNDFASGMRHFMNIYISTMGLINMYDATFDIEYIMNGEIMINILSKEGERYQKI